MLKLADALQLKSAGLSVIPIKPDGSKSPAVSSWKPYQSELAADAELETWYGTNGKDTNYGVGIVAGAISKNLLVLDFDDRETAIDFRKKMDEIGAKDLLDKCPAVQTPSGGFHLYIRTRSVVAGNQKLAMRKTAEGSKVLIETRGEGGYVLGPGSPAECHKNNKIYKLIRGSLADIPILDDDECELFLEVAKSFNEHTHEHQQVHAPEAVRTSTTGNRPGDDYNSRHCWSDILAPLGWTAARTHGGKTDWRKPGKQGPGLSATTNHAGTDLLYVFSTSASPFEPERTYDKFAAYALLNHNGDFSEAARVLSQVGYGSPPIVSTRKSASAQPEEWTEPKPINCRLLPVPALPVALIPPPLAPWLEDISHRMQCPIDFAAVSAIVMLSSVIGAACGVRPKRRDDWLVIPNVWGGIVGRPGMLKSPALQEATRPLKMLEALAKGEFDEKQRAYEVDCQMFKGQQEKLKGSLRAKHREVSEDRIREQFLELEEPTKPRWRRYLTNDATPEKMTEILNENPRGVLLLRDELTGMLATWEKPGRESDRAFHIEAWNGDGSYTTDRIGRGSTHCPNLCESILGGIQPGKLESFLYQSTRGEGNDGLVQRFQLLVYPDEPVWQHVDDYPNKDARKRVNEIINKLAFADFTEYGAVKTDEDRFAFWSFDTEAQELFNEWLAGLQHKLESEESTMMQEHLSKYRSLMPSLSLIFHLVEVIDGTAPRGNISLASAERAAAWCDYLEAHARRIYGMVADPSIKASSILSDRLTRGELEDGFSVRDVHRKQWSFLTDVDVVRSACENLVDAGWLREQISDTRKVTYLINPTVTCKKGSNG